MRSSCCRHFRPIPAVQTHIRIVFCLRIPVVHACCMPGCSTSCLASVQTDLYDQDRLRLPVTFFPRAFWLEALLCPPRLEAIRIGLPRRSVANGRTQTLKDAGKALSVVFGIDLLGGLRSYWPHGVERVQSARTSSGMGQADRSAALQPQPPPRLYAESGLPKCHWPQTAGKAEGSLDPRARRPAMDT